MDDRVEIKDLELGTPTDNDLLVFQSVSDDEVYKAPKSDLKGDKGDKGDTGEQGIQGIQGIQGVKGDKGDTGDNATADAGTTTTLPAGQSASVTNVGTTSDAVFDFAIPQGIKGDDGACLESVAFVGNDMVFTLDDESTVTLVNAKLDLKGDTGDTGASIVSASFVGNDLVFVKDDATTVTLTNAKVILTGPQGATGSTGATGKGITTITKTGTVGLVDTYTITYSDSTTSTFDVTNGADGTDGTDGISYIWKGTYDAGTSYSANDCVTYLGTSYIYINVTPGSGHTPADDSYWDILALKGNDGVGTGDVLGPATNTADYIPQWDGANSKTLKNGIPISTFAPALGADDNYVTNAEKIIIGNTSGTNTGDNATNTTSNSYADGKIIDSIADSDTTHAPSRNSVYDALALKSPIASPTFTGTVTMPALAITASDATGNLATITNTDATNYSRIKYIGTVNSFSSGVGNGSATITDLVNKFYIYDFTNSKVAMTIVPNTLATKLYGSLETVGNIELGHATDTTLSRVSAGVIAVEGKTILTTDNIEDSIVDGHTTIAPSGNAVYDALALKDTKTDLTKYSNLNAPEGFLINGKIVPSVSSNNLTVAIKGMDGNDPSATNPVYIRIGDTIRSITSALSVTKNAGTNWMNAGSAELATKEIDYFVYLSFNTSNSKIILGFSRIPYATLVGDFSIGDTTEKAIMVSDANWSGIVGGDSTVNIGRFASTLSAGASYTWTVPTFTSANLIQRPIFETRKLSYTPVATGFSSNPVLTGGYKIMSNLCQLYVGVTTPGTSNANTFTITSPIILDLASPVLTMGVDNSAFTSVTIIYAVGNVISLGKGATVDPNSWTSSNNKYAYINQNYTIN